MKARTEEGNVSRVLVTRSKRGNAELSERLASLGFDPISVDTIQFEGLDSSKIDRSLNNLASFDWLAFTSATGVEFFVRRMRQLGLQLPGEGRPLVAAVGEKTSRSLRKEGVRMDFIPTQYLGKTLAEEIPRGKGRRVLVLRADEGEPGLTVGLEARGFEVEDLAVYRTVSSIDAADQALGEVDAVVFASPSAVEGLMSKPGGAKASLRNALAVCIGPTTEASARAHGFSRTVVPQSHTLDGVVAELRRARREG